MKKNILILLPFLMFVSCHPLRGFIESEFTLAQESPLPAWYPKLPEGYTRGDVTIKLRYYNPPFDIDNTVFWVESSWWHTLYKATGKSEHHPAYWKWANEDRTARRYPSFVNVTINGITEIIEHKKMEPIFYISNEETVKKVMSKSK
jgi:hypothetical protein